MKQFTVLLLLWVFPCLTVHGQEADSRLSVDAVIEKVDISGIGEDRLSTGLRGDLQKLAGQKFNGIVADELADRIQGELPEYVAAPKTLPGSQADAVRLMFVVAHISGDDALGSNINSRYPIESVELEGAPRSRVSDALYGDMQKMVGGPLDNRQADTIRERLASELGPAYDVVRKVQRSMKQRQLKIIYEVFKIPWLPIRDPESFASYHSQQGFSLAATAGTGAARHRTESFSFGVANDGDTLIERFAGFHVGYENVRLGTDRLGIKFDYSSYRDQWNVHTINASLQTPGIPGLYRRRRNLEASMAFAFNPSLYVTLGVMASDLEMTAPAVHFVPSRAAVTSIRYRRKFETGEARHEFEGGYDIHAAARSLESDFVYTRHLWDGHYRYRRDRHTIRLAASGGRITGQAPLFERFTLGNSRTLRGWNKFDFAPLGGSRMAYASFEYHYRGLGLFYDAGSLWDRGEAVKVRPSVGIGFGDENGFYLGIAIPVREAGLTPAFLVVCRFNAS